jgi:hypothetical protein
MTEDRELGDRQRAAQAATEGIERALFNEASDKVEVALYVNGRMIQTRSDAATVQRIMAILTGLEA